MNYSGERIVFRKVAQVSMTDADFCDLSDKCDYHYWLRLRDQGVGDDRATLRLAWSRSKRRGQHQRLVDRRRRRLFSPGRYHASSPSGFYLNKHFVQGWRGVNPVRMGMS